MMTPGKKTTHISGSWLLYSLRKNACVQATSSNPVRLYCKYTHAAACKTKNKHRTPNTANLTCIPELGEPDGLLHEDWPISPKSSCLPSNLHLSMWIGSSQCQEFVAMASTGTSHFLPLIPNPLHSQGTYASCRFPDVMWKSPQSPCDNYGWW